MKKLAKKYSVIEINRVISRFDGDLKDQYKMAKGVDELENGMCVVVDDVKGEIKKPSGENDAVWLHYSEEKIYDGKPLNTFVLKKDQALPRVYKLRVGDTFTTDAIDLDTQKFESLKPDTTPVYAVPDASGLWKLTTTKPVAQKVALQVVKAYTMPNGIDPGLKLVVIKADYNA